MMAMLNQLQKARDIENYEEVEALRELIVNEYFPNFKHIHQFGNIWFQERFENNQNLVFIDKDYNSFYLESPKEISMIE